MTDSDLTTRLEKIEEEIQRIKKYYDRTIDYQSSDPEASLWMARKAAEAICRDIFVREISNNPGRLTLDKFLDRLASRKIIPRHILNPFRTIQVYGNYGTHDHGEDPHVITAEYIQPCLRSLSTVVEWYVTEYHEKANAGSEDDEDITDAHLDVRLKERPNPASNEISSAESSPTAGPEDATDKQSPGTVTGVTGSETVLSRFARAVSGMNIFFYLLAAEIAAIILYTVIHPGGITHKFFMGRSFETGLFFMEGIFKPTVCRILLVAIAGAASFFILIKFKRLFSRFKKNVSLNLVFFSAFNALFLQILLLIFFILDVLDQISPLW